MKRFAAAAGLSSVLLCAAAFADVVELKTGERVEGVLKQATPTTVSIEVAGQTLTIEGGKVRAIYFGSAPSVSQPTNDLEALTALKALQSVTRAGVVYRDYSTRIGDAKVQVDRGIPAIKRISEDAAKALTTAMDYYAAAARVWGSNISSRITWFAHKSYMPESCEHYKTAVASARSFREDPNGVVHFLRGEVPITQIFWACATDKITEAESFLNR